MSSAMMAAVSKSITWLTEAMTPFFIRAFTTSAPVFFMREANSPTLISSGISTLRGAFLAISSCRRRIFSCSSWRRLLEKVILPPRRLLLRNFSLPCCILPARWPALELSAMSCRRSSYLSRLTLAALRVSTILVLGTREVAGAAGAVAGAGAFPPLLTAEDFSAAPAAGFVSSCAV